jgi:hypothetical protein
LSIQLHGISVFYKDAATKQVFHTYSTYARGTDMLNVGYHSSISGGVTIGPSAAVAITCIPRLEEPLVFALQLAIELDPEDARVIRLKSLGGVQIRDRSRHRGCAPAGCRGPRSTPADGCRHGRGDAQVIGVERIERA